MDLTADYGTLPTNSTVGGPALEQELSLSSVCCETESGGTILLQLLEFKSHLLECVEELHIRRDAETRFEDQISKLVLEKQELEWEKESLLSQIETAANQHSESLINVKKQFQAKIRSTEEEKGKYQVSAELKDKEINSLKEELKSLQLLKYNLEKKSSELEQKLALQSRSKDSHLNQLGEVERRFSALSRQCAMVKQAHNKLEMNVDEAIKRNKELTSANEKQEATIVSLKKELEEVSNKLIKAKVSSVRHDKSHSPTSGGQRIQQLHQKLNMETEMSKRLQEECVALRAEKQEVMRSLQCTQQLLLSQTQTVSRVELELQTQREQHQALKQEHEVMREKSKAAEDKVAQLMVGYAASKTSWDKERQMLLDHIKSEQQDLRAVNEAYHKLHQKHTELSSQAKVQAEQIYELERRDSSQSLDVSTPLFPTLVEEIRGEETLHEPISLEPPGSGSLQHLASTHTKKPDCLEDTGAVTQLVATGATGGQDTPDPHQQSQFKQPRNPLNLLACSLTNNNPFSLCSPSGTTGSDSSIINQHIHNSYRSESDPDVVSDLIHTASSVSDVVLKSKSSCVSDTSTPLNPGHRSVHGSVNLLSKETSDGGKSEKEHEWSDDVKRGKNNREAEERHEEQQWNREVKGKDLKEGENAPEERGTLMAQTTDRADRRKDNRRLTKDAGDTKQPETVTKDRAEGEGTDGAEERGKTGPYTPETQIPAQTTTDKTAQKSDKQPVIDFMDTEPPLAACESSECSQGLSQKASEKVADSSHVNKGNQIRRKEYTFCSDDHQRLSHEPNSVVQEVQILSHDEAQTFAHNLLPQVFEKTAEEKPSDNSSADIPAELSEPLNQSNVYSSQTKTAAFPAQSDHIVSIQELEITASHTQPIYPSDISRNMTQTDGICDTHVREDCLSVRTKVEPLTLPQSQEISKQQCGQLRSLLTDDEDDDSSTYKKREGQSNVETRANNACETAQEALEKSNLQDACVDISMDTVDLESEAETGSCQELWKNDKIEDAEDAKTTKSGTDLTMSTHPSHENNASPETSSANSYEQRPAEEMLLNNTDESFLPSNKTYRSSFDWGSAQRKEVSSRTKSDVSVPHQFVQGSPVSEQHISGPSGLIGHPSSTERMFLKSKPNKVPLVITRASDLLNASSVSRTAASPRTQQQGEWKNTGETCRETATADVDSRASPSIRSFPVSTSSIIVNRLSWQTTPGCSRASTSASGPSSESDWEPSCSQERENQQSSFRAQVSKIEQFLNTERLRLSKRRRTDN